MAAVIGSTSLLSVTINLDGIFLPVHAQYAMNPFVSFVNLIAGFSSSENDFATREDEKDNFRFVHTEDKPGKCLGIIVANVFLLIPHPYLFVVFLYVPKHLFQINSKAGADGSNYILYFEILHHNGLVVV